MGQENIEKSNDEYSKAYSVPAHSLGQLVLWISIATLVSAADGFLTAELNWCTSEGPRGAGG